MIDQAVARDYSTEKYFFDVQYHANESRRLIERAANQVAETMDEVCVQLGSLVKPGKKLLANIRKANYRWPEETERMIVSNYQEAENNLNQLREMFLKKENAAVCDPKLFGKHEKLVRNGYLSGAQAVEIIIDILQDIRWAVMEHSADIDEIVRTESAEEFLASVG